MSYATITDIQGEFKSITFSTSTAVTTTQITGFLADADALINSRLSCRYSVPITGTESLIMVKLIEVYLVKNRILQILKVKTGKDSEDQDSSGVGYEKRAMTLLDDIIARKMNLRDATAATPAEGVRSYSNDNTSSVPYKFNRESKQW